MAKAVASVVFTVLGLAVISGCSDGALHTAGVRVDTLPSGVVHLTSLKRRDSAQWRLRVLHDLHTAPGTDAELVSPEDIAVSANGLVAIVDDASPLTVKLFAASGGFLGSVGRLGAGPGEFSQARITFFGDTVVVLDPSQRRLLLFDVSSRALIAEHQNVCCASYYPIGRDGSGALVASRMIDRSDPGSTAPGFTRFRIDGSVIDTAWTLRRDPMAGSFVVRQGEKVLGSAQIPFWPEDRWTVDGAGVLLFGSATDYVLRTSRTGLDTLLLFSHTSSSRVSVTDDEKSAWIEERVARDRKFVSEPLLREALRADGIPDYHPWFDRLWVDLNGYRWVALGRRAGEPLQLDLYDRDGQWLDVVTVASRDWPSDSWAPIAFGGDRVAVVITGDDGFPVVRVSQIERSTSSN